MPKISIVIAIYNMEDYIERCLHSLFSQTLDEIEYVFVDDASTDSSLMILKRVLRQYSNRKLQIKIIKNNTNLGIAETRKKGIKVSNGKFIIHCDPDDYVDKDWCRLLYEKATEENADIVICNHYTIKENSIKESKIQSFKSPLNYLHNWFKSDCDYSPLWDKLVKRSLILDNSIYPFPGLDLGEDMWCIVRFFFHANKISVVKENLYYYCIRENSLTTCYYTEKQIKKKIELINQISQFLCENKYNVLSNNFKFNTKIQLLKYFKNKESEWYELFKECHKDIIKFSENSFKVRLFWFFSLLHPLIFKYSKYLISKWI